MKKLLYLLLLLLVPITCHAETSIHVYGYKPEETAQHIQATVDYFQKKYNLTLHKDMVVWITKTKKEYKKEIKELNLYPTLADTTYAFTTNAPAITYILVNRESCGDRVWFTLTHELVHAYQNEHYSKEHNNDYAMTEGKADLVASEITGYPIKIQDHGIPCESMKDYEGHGRAIVDYGVDKVDEQVRFYASQTPGFFP